MLFATQEKSHNPVTCLAWGKESNIIFSGYSSGKIIVSHFQSEKVQYKFTINITTNELSYCVLFIEFPLF